MNDKPAFPGQKARDAHALAIGKIAMAWNEYQATLGEMYADMFTRANWNFALASWYAIPSDKTQRDMLRSVVAYKFQPSSPEFSELNWLISKTDEIVSGQRNIGLHTRLFSVPDLSGGHVIVPVAHNDRVAKAFENTDILKEYAHYEVQIRQMLTFAIGMQAVLSPRRKGEKKWPARPTLSKRSPPPQPTKSSQ
jgi:hypothetical protein